MSESVSSAAEAAASETLLSTVQPHQQGCGASSNTGNTAAAASDAAKKALNLVVIGHVDAGKSTTTGHLLVKCGGIDKRIIAKFEAEAAAIGKKSFMYAWAMDKLQSERDRGITIDAAASRFETDKAVFTIIDAPGHRDFIKNMISGASQADVGLLIVSVLPGEFEAGFSKEGQTKEHALLAYSVGVKQLIVCCNKMDKAAINYSQGRFEEVRREVASFIGKLGYDKAAVPIIPVSGWEGDNMTTRSANMPWYDGPTLVEALDALSPPQRIVEEEAPLRIPIANAFKVGGIGVVVVGRVATGVLRPGDEVVFAPSGAKGTVGLVEHHNQPLTEAKAGTHVGFSVKGVSLSEIRRGHVCGHRSTSQDPPREVTSFTAQIIVINHDGPISAGYAPILDVHAAHVSCKMECIEARIDRRTGKLMDERPPSLKVNEAGVVRFTPSRPLCIEVYDEYPPLGRFTLRDDKRTVAVGVVRSIQRKGDEKK